MPVRETRARRFDLYTRAVQSPEREVDLLGARFRRLRGREALTLREDFAGSGATSRAWVESDDDRTAEAVDHDRAAIAYGRALAADLGEDAERLSFVRADVTRRSERAFDLIAAMNFSWAVLGDEALRAYLEAARASLEDDGLLALEFFGGPRLQTPHEVEHRLAGFNYRFEVKSYEAPWMTAALHFESDGERDDDAFRYRFCLRSPDVLDAALEAADFRIVTWLYEDRRGRYVARRGRPRAELWTAIVLCEANR